MTVSVIIATYNRADLLRECLRFLVRQPFGPGDEILVVDNGSTDRTPEVIRAAAAESQVPVRGLLERTPGKSFALQRALGAATGDILAFTDDDVDVGDGWLSAIRERLSEPGVALVGGPVVARWERQPPAWLRSVANGAGRLAAPLGLLNYGDAVAPLGDRTLLGANMAIRREPLRQVGGFETSLGKLRGTLLSGEDHEFCRRVQAAGFGAVYDPAALVRHWVPANRMRLRYYASWFYWSGITHSALEAEVLPRRAVAGVPLYLVRRAARAAWRGPAAALAGHFRTAVESLIDIAFVLGYARRRWEGSA